MSKFGGWNVDVPRDKMPQKVATAVGNLNELFGAGYEFKAYLGEQEVNGINRAVLCEQTVYSGKDTKNAVVVIFNEKPGVIDASLVDIHRIVEAGGPLGGTQVAITDQIPEEAKEAFEAAKAGFVGSNIVPFIFIGTKIVKGAEYKFLAEMSAVVPGAEKYLVLLTVNSLSKKMTFEPVLE